MNYLKKINLYSKKNYLKCYICIITINCLGMYKIRAFQIAENIDIKSIKKNYADKLIFSSPNELFYSENNEKFLYILSYGVVVFSGYEVLKMTEMIEYIKTHSTDALTNKHWEDFVIHDKADEDLFAYNEIFLTSINASVMRIVMLNVGQSVALDYFTEKAEQILDTTTEYTLQLEKNGKISISSKKLRIFIGKTLNMKNRVFDNLYILDSPDITWDNQYLNKIDNALKDIFDLKIRFRNIEYQLRLAKENLDLFKDFMQHKKSNQLEWIIIILILVEVVNMFIEKIFK